jgi:hypothetical protein
MFGMIFVGMQVVKCSACVVRDYGREAEAHDVLRVSHPSYMWSNPEICVMQQTRGLDHFTLYRLNRICSKSFVLRKKCRCI